MDLLNRIGKVIELPYDAKDKRLLIDLYSQAFPLKEKLDINCSSCGMTAYRKLTYFYNNNKTIEMADKTAKAEAYKIKNGGERIVFPNLGLVITNDQLNDKVVEMLKRKLGAGFDNHFEKA